MKLSLSHFKDGKKLEKRWEKNQLPSCENAKIFLLQACFDSVVKRTDTTE